MATDIMSGFGGFENIAIIGQWILVFIGALIFAVMCIAAVIFIIIKLKEKKIIEISIAHRKVREFSGRERKNKGGRQMTWVGKLKKWLPKLQEADTYLMKGNKEMVLLLKDNNGLHHSLRIPTESQLKKWYDAQGINVKDKIDEIKEKLKEEGLEDDAQQNVSMISKIKEMVMGAKTSQAINVIGTVYLIPNVLEDLNWMADQSMEADKTYNASFWQSPSFIFLGTFAMLVILTIMWLIIMQRF